MTVKTLSKDRAVEAACILFELNTDPQQIMRMATEAGLMEQGIDKDILCRQWYAFVHAAVVAGLMVHAPNSVLVDYLRSTSALLKKHGIPKKDVKSFVDNDFSPYMELLGKEEQQQCPQIFFQKVCHSENMQAVPSHTLACVAGTMALLLSTIADKLEQYDMQSV